MKKYNSRNEVEEKYKWNLDEYFKSDEEFAKTFKECKELIDNLKSFVGCTNDANKLYEFIISDLKASSMMENLYVYAYLVNDQELGISKNQNRKNKCEDLINKYSLNTSFFCPELLKLDKGSYEKLFIDNSKLDEFKVMLDKIYRSKEHILDEDKENIISNLCNALDHYEEMSSTMLNAEHNYGSVVIDGEEERITPTNLSRLLKIEDRNIRKEVREKYNKVLASYASTSASCLNGYVKGNITVNQMHNFKDAFTSKLFHLNLDESAYKTITKVVEDNVDALQKYFKVFKETLKLDELYQYDLGLELAKSAKKYSIEEAQDLCLKSVAILGEDYVNHFKKIIDNRYVDYACYPKKCSGGYSFSTMDKDSRILMSYNYDLDSVSTLIHEGGHNVHHQLVKENNKIEYRDISNLMAEVASLTNECLLSNYLMKHGSSKEERLAGISNILSVIISNLFGAVREGKMEIDFYNYALEGNSLTKDYLNDLTYKSLEKYYGDTVKLDDNSKNSWIRRSHYYMNYYLYNYAFCISVAASTAKKIIDGDKDMLNKYMKYLSTGSNVWPKDAFKILDIDLSDETVYINAINYFREMIDEFVKVRDMM